MRWPFKKKEVTNCPDKLEPKGNTPDLPKMALVVEGGVARIVSEEPLKYILMDYDAKDAGDKMPSIENAEIVSPGAIQTYWKAFGEA